MEQNLKPQNGSSRIVEDLISEHRSQTSEPMLQSTTCTTSWRRTTNWERRSRSRTNFNQVEKCSKPGFERGVRQDRGWGLQSFFRWYLWSYWDLDGWTAREADEWIFLVRTELKHNELKISWDIMSMISSKISKHLQHNCHPQGISAAASLHLC